MNKERPAPPLTLSTDNLSADGAHVTPNRTKANGPVTETAALAASQAFARLTFAELADVEARIYLAGPRIKVAVQNVRGRLFAAQVPESINTAVESSPEEIIARPTERDPGATTVKGAGTVQAVAPTTGAAQHSGGRRSRVRSGWTVAALAVVAAIVG